ncbi:MAG: hypothetical protein M3209_10760 [Acidobacteriota bacterium]|nr:hypothetical protein [Acidobacteriota bacterium]
MHVHSLTVNRYEWVFPLLVANGVIGIREMGSNIPYQYTNQIRREISEGKLLGPRLEVATAKIFDGSATALTTNVEVVSTTEQARSLVKDYKQQGIDFVKPYNFLSREVFLAIVDEAKRQKITVAGHVPYSMTAAEVSDSGQISIEHNNDILISVSLDEVALRQELKDLPKSLPFTARQPIQAKAAATFDQGKAAALFERFARNGTWFCPTTVGLSEETQNPNDPRLKYIPARSFLRQLCCAIYWH